MKLKVYIETTIPSFLTARPSRDLVHVAHQQVTREWWERRRDAFDLYTSQAVLNEAGRGNPEAAQRRIRLTEGLTLLPIEDAATKLAQDILGGNVMPRKAAVDALHVAIATVHRLDVLLTWNCRHLANAEIIGGLRDIVRRKGLELPIICTPEELMGRQGDKS